MKGRKGFHPRTVLFNCGSANKRWSLIKRSGKGSDRLSQRLAEGLQSDAAHREKSDVFHD